MRVFLTVALLILPLSFGQTTADKATQLAAQHPAFASVLAAREGYTAAAYDTQNAYGIWRVQFWEAEGASIGWIDVEPEAEKVYAWRYDVDANDIEKNAAKPIIAEVLKNNGEFLNLVGEFNPDEIKVNYNKGQAFWLARLERGPDTVAVTLRPEQARARSPENLHIETIFSPTLFHSKTGARVMRQASSRLLLGTRISLRRCAVIKTGRAPSKLWATLCGKLTLRKATSS